MIALKQARRILAPLTVLLLASVLLIFRQNVELQTGLSLGAFPITTVYLAAAWLGSRAFSLFVDGWKRRHRPYPRLVKDLVAVLFFFGAVIASTASLLDQGLIGALAGSSLIIAMLGFAIRNVVADTLSGVALGVEGPFRIGDWVDIDQTGRGKIIEIGWRTTRMLTLDQTYLILPNSQIARRRITNYSAPRPHYRAQIMLKLARDLPVARARPLILGAMKDARLIQSDPPPDVKVVELGSDGITYALRFWVSRFERDVDCRDELLSLIDAALVRAEVGLPKQRIELSRTDLEAVAQRRRDDEVDRVFARPKDKRAALT